MVNFSKNIDWGHDSITIGVVGKTKALQELESLLPGNPNISLKKIYDGSLLDDCQLIFLPNSQKRNFNLIQQKIEDSPIVLVTENDDLVHKGAEISFYLEGNRLKFTLNQTALEEINVIGSDRLLSVARIIN